MLGTLTMGLKIDAFGPISDNAGGIAEMSQLDEWVRERTDVLDAADNTMAAIGKGFAIGSSALVSLVLFGDFCVRADITGVDIIHSWVFIGLLFDAMMSYAFAALTMKFVGKAANEMVRVPRQQLMGCYTADSTCNGGFMDDNFAFAEKNGSCTEASYSNPNNMLSGLKHLRNHGCVGQPPANTVDWSVMGAATLVPNRKQCDGSRRC